MITVLFECDMCRPARQGSVFILLYHQHKNVTVFQVYNSPDIYVTDVTAPHSAMTSVITVPVERDMHKPARQGSVCRLSKSMINQTCIFTQKKQGKILSFLQDSDTTVSTMKLKTFSCSTTPMQTKQPIEHVSEPISRPMRYSSGPRL